MTPPRVVLVSRRFWPLFGGAEAVMADLAVGLREAGADVTVLTAQWERNWPAEVSHRGVRVVRIAQPRLRFWGTWRYLRGLETWLRQHRAEYDLAYVSMLKHDAYAAVSVGRELKFPVVLRVEGAGLTGDVHWQLNANFGRRIRSRCYKADAFVAMSDAIERELISAGYPRQRLCRIPNAVRVGPQCSAKQRDEARQALGETHPLLAMSQQAPVAVYTGRLQAGKGLETLIEAWSRVAAKRPDARLWIVGDGPERAALWRQIDDAGLDGRVVLAGSFDTVDDFLAAADLFILPSLEEGMSRALLEAMAAGLPVVATDIAGNRTLVENDVQGLLVPVHDAEALAQAIDRVWNDSALANRLGAAARERVQKEFSLDQQVRAHLDLFAGLIKERSK